MPLFDRKTPETTHQRTAGPSEPRPPEWKVNELPLGRIYVSEMDIEAGIV